MKILKKQYQYQNKIIASIIVIVIMLGFHPFHQVACAADNSPYFSPAYWEETYENKNQNIFITFLFILSCFFNATCGRSELIIIKLSQLMRQAMQPFLEFLSSEQNEDKLTSTEILIPTSSSANMKKCPTMSIPQLKI